MATTNAIAPAALARGSRSASYALAGRHVEASKAMARVRELDPAMCMANVKNCIPLRRPRILGRLEERAAKSRVAGEVS